MVGKLFGSISVKATRCVIHPSTHARYLAVCMACEQNALRDSNRSATLPMNSFPLPVVRASLPSDLGSFRKNGRKGPGQTGAQPRIGFVFSCLTAFDWVRFAIEPAALGHFVRQNGPHLASFRNIPSASHFVRQNVPQFGFVSQQSPQRGHFVRQNGPNWGSFGKKDRSARPSAVLR